MVMVTLPRTPVICGYGTVRPGSMQVTSPAHKVSKVLKARPVPRVPKVTRDLKGAKALKVRLGPRGRRAIKGPVSPGRKARLVLKVVPGYREQPGQPVLKAFRVPKEPRGPL